MKKTCLSVLFLVLFLSSALCQNLIGIKKDSATEIVRKEMVFCCNHEKKVIV